MKNLSIIKIFTRKHYIELIKEKYFKLNKELLKVVDIRYGKPYEEETTQECNKFIFKLISGSKDEIKKIAESGIY